MGIITNVIFHYLFITNLYGEGGGKALDVIVVLISIGVNFSEETFFEFEDGEVDEVDKNRRLFSSKSSGKFVLIIELLSLS